LNRSLVLLCQIVLLMCPSTLLAQRGGHSAGHPATGASNPTPNTSDISDFNRAIALQATPDQIAQFQQLNKSTEAANKQAQNLIEHAEDRFLENARRPNSSRYTDLSDTVDEAETDIQHFVSSFSTAQQSGLKPQIKKLSKADSDVSKQRKALEDGKKILDQISRETGGRLYEVSKKQAIDQIYDSIAEELRTQYNLGYTPDKSNTEAGYHKITLVAKQKDLVVQTRDGYYAER
jgi:hypothetical protein